MQIVYMRELNDASPLTFGQSHEDEKALRFLKNQVKTFVTHLRMNYLDEETTKNLLTKFADVQLLPYKKGSTSGTYTSGMFDHASGILYVAPRDGSGDLRDTASLNKSICHELAHGTRFKYPGETSHSSEWKTAWKRFLRIATEDLGWVVEVPCSSMSFYGLQHDDCPACKWEVGDNCKSNPIK
ncbi:hypothetical protein ATCVTN60342_609R [Acanthocystis turfacea Chlorella virus TN603.4.2]|nr:hypothetical protein ATCVTN60342_609R [Acanthocystis turfacea Chlorella virus TN603.4.2]